jgi:hypothetical protein
MARRLTPQAAAILRKRYAVLLEDLRQYAAAHPA